MNGKIKLYFQKAKKVFGDFFWSIAATMMCTVIMQLLVYPLLAKWLNSSVYGEVLTIMAIANIIVVALGNGINNTRLIQSEKYSQKLQGDFNVLLGIITVLSSIIMAVILFVFFPINYGNILLIVLYVFLGILRAYWSVAYRLKIDFISNFKLNALVACGYLLGLSLTKVTKIWMIPFVVAELFGVLYLIKTTDLYKESYKRTALFPETSKILAVLCFNSLLANVVTYLDRLVLYPILGGTQVSIFTVSSFVGKSIGLVLTPIAGVLLSYYAQESFRMTLKKYWGINLSLIVGGFICGGLAVLLAPLFTRILYPTLIDASMPYIYIANLATLVGILSNIISPAVLKYADVRWQLIIQVINIVMYFSLGMIMLKANGLYGFCVATFVVNFIRIMILLILGHKGVKKRVEMVTKTK